MEKKGGYINEIKRTRLFLALDKYVYHIIILSLLLYLTYANYKNTEFQGHIIAEVWGIALSIFAAFVFVNRHERRYWLKIRPVLCNGLKRNLFEILTEFYINTQLYLHIDTGNDYLSGDKKIESITGREMATAFEEISNVILSQCENDFTLTNSSGNPIKCSDILIKFYEGISANIFDIKYFTFPIILQHSRDDCFINLMIEFDNDLLELEKSIRLYEDGILESVVKEFAELLRTLGRLAIILGTI